MRSELCKSLDAQLDVFYQLRDALLEEEHAEHQHLHQLQVGLKKVILRFC